MRKICASLTVLLLLSGCATSWVVDSEVHSHGAVPSFTPGAGYRFERLPSQQDSDFARAAQSDLEAMAAPALAAVGLQPDARSPRYSVQVSARVDRVLSPWDSPWMYGAWGSPWTPYGGWGLGWYGPPPQPWYVREVSVVMRQLPGNEVVYETRARHDGPYNLSRQVLPVMFRAALQGFPTPPPGPRRVDIELGTDAPRVEADAQASPAAPAPRSTPALPPR